MSLTTDRLGLTAMQTVRPPRALRVLAFVLGALFVGVPPSLFVIPWRQNVPASGKVSALDPLDRIQVIRAPVAGRLSQLFVQEGQPVEEGDLLAIMADLDDRRRDRLAVQLDNAREKVAFEEFLISKLESLQDFATDARDRAIEAAEAKLESARNELAKAQQSLTGKIAWRDQKKLDVERKRSLIPDGVVSGLEFQEVEAAFLSAEAEVGAAQADVEKARNQVLAAQADVSKITAEEAGKIAKIMGDIAKAQSELQNAKNSVQTAEGALVVQETQEIRAPRSGYIQRVTGAGSSELISAGTPLIDLVPDNVEIAVELWVRGVDAPLITPGREVRLQFEGTPAVQWVGWPSVAVGTYGGVVAFVDAHGNQDGMFRVLVSPDLTDLPWPTLPQIRQGTRANGWLLLDEVSLGYEIWRNLNAFPPSVRTQPDKAGGEGEPQAKASGAGFVASGDKGKK